jgi:hypothetical protein
MPLANEAREFLSPLNQQNAVAGAQVIQRSGGTCFLRRLNIHPERLGP